MWPNKKKKKKISKVIQSFSKPTITECFSGLIFARQTFREKLVFLYTRFKIYSKIDIILNHGLYNTSLTKMKQSKNPYRYVTAKTVKRVRICKTLYNNWNFAILPRCLNKEINDFSYLKALGNVRWKKKSYINGCKVTFSRTYKNSVKTILVNR